jgi:hypothetical protein
LSADQVARFSKLHTRWSPREGAAIGEVRERLVGAPTEPTTAASAQHVPRPTARSSAVTGAAVFVTARRLPATPEAQQQPGESLLRATATTVLVAMAFLIFALVFAGQLGLGDVVLIGLLSGTLAYRSWVSAVAGLAAGLLLQVPAVLVAAARGQRRASFPLGPALGAGWLIALVAMS